ncbi:amino acid permease [Aneurinibacillus uraniidurans]|uniref:amino acid permease n=1 Tax=Aneurinibacillus uraniidurans TaxID=2966586 RepID=UPI00234B24E8|nr:amino acid permease [Aneurinibacillus sp. B1]WCN37636.1 amino acid permease [Aneurinibacillus sp. B1]
MGNGNQHELQRTMKSRHLFMISIGGVIGTGLFLGAGYTINQAGPGGAVLAYIAGGFLMYLVMLCLGELAVAMPVAGSFQTYASKYIGPATGFTIGWMYWLNWAVTVGVEFTAAGMLMKRWFPMTPVWVWCIVFAVSLFLMNAFSAKSFAETEFWFSSIKVVAIILFIVVGSSVLFGFISIKGQHAPMFSNFVNDGGLFPKGISAVLLSMIAVTFSFQGTEVIGVAAGESEKPEKTIPRSIRATAWRTMFFYVISMIVLVGLIPWRKAGVIESPFVMVFDGVGIPYAADFMNFVILTAVLSVGNSGLYAGSRMLWGLARDGMASPFLGKLSRKQIPLNALITTLAVACLSLLSSFVAEDTLYVLLVSVAGLAGIVVWLGVGVSQYLFRKRFLEAGGKLDELKYRTPLYPFVPILCTVLCSIVIVSMAFDAEQRMALYCGLPFMAGCYLYYFLRIKKKQEGEQTTNEIETTQFVGNAE